VAGVWLVGWGFFQKLFVADNLSHLVDAVFDPTASPTGGDALVGIYAFAFQILCDFAGYSNIARGLSKLMGIELNVNFLFPYFAISPREFWQQWHISLSTWLRDYLYIPLGGSRGSRWKTYRNLMITMVLGGLWHGAAWTFVLWGAFHGIALIVNHQIASWSNRRGWATAAGLTWQRVLLGAAMFQVTAVGMMMIRAESVPQIVELLWRVVTDFRFGPDTVRSLVLPFVQVVVPFLAVHIYQARMRDETAPLRWSLVPRYALYGAVFFLVLLFGDFQGAQFIYFQF
jgi:D-alanyl-lipoteichoic acid acyltransferase DltB (MBOAT superfamily)